MSQILIYRIISILEGISYILLLGVGVPLKYFFKNEAWVKALGMPHGLLFIAYIFMTIVLKQRYNLSTKTVVILFIASVVPFGTLYTDRKIVKNIAA
jgi:integral membrane protein